ncbi:MAG: hypothetical protein ACRD4O_15985 [Bryobacteraceae bacterium]
MNRLTGKTYSDGTPAVTYAYNTGTNGKGRHVLASNQETPPAPSPNSGILALSVKD